MLYIKMHARKMNKYYCLTAKTISRFILQQANQLFF